MRQTLVREVMRGAAADVELLPPVEAAANIFDVAVRMLNEKQNRMRVMDGERIVGTVSMIDVLRAACAR